MKFSKQTVGLFTDDNKPLENVEADVCGNLAVHRPIGGGDWGWVITHVPTGLIVTYCFKKAWAKKAALELLTKVPTLCNEPDPKKAAAAAPKHVVQWLRGLRYGNEFEPIPDAA